MCRAEKSVLLIDDERTALAGWSLYLQGASYQVVSASNVQEGLEFFATKPVDAVVLDFHMPEMNGDEAAAQMKRMKPNVVIVMFSGDRHAVRTEHPLFDAFLIKGQHPSVLLNMLDSLLNIEQHAASEPGSAYGPVL